MDEQNITPSPNLHRRDFSGDQGLRLVAERLSQNLERDRLVQDTLSNAQQQLVVDRLVLYYFFSGWRGQVTSEALADPKLSILGSSGPDDCFNSEYAERYLKGRVYAIADIAIADIAPCHREFLEDLLVKANLVVPVLVHQRLWGLLVAHHCRQTRDWTKADISLLKSASHTLAAAPAIQGS
jgi:GAF domain-containing protein